MKWFDRAAAEVLRPWCWVAAALLWPLAASGQEPPARPDTVTDEAERLRRYPLAPVTVSATRVDLPLRKIPNAVQLVDQARISKARPTWGLDEALVTVPGIYASNRYYFTDDQRLSIRGFGARAAFGIRGIKVLLDGIPQTLPDGTGQLTNLELGAVDRIEVLRGSSSALFGNASGGVISVWTRPLAPEGVAEEVRVEAGTFSRDQVPLFDAAETWSKWQSSTRFRVGSGSGFVTLSRLDFRGERQHSDADLRNLNTRWQFPLAPGWSLTAIAAYGDQPRLDNPGALTADELAANPDAAAPINISKRAGKDVWQVQGGATLRREFVAGGEVDVTLFGIRRSLKQAQTYAYIDLDRWAYGARVSATRPVPLGALPHRLTAGVDFQAQRDDRLNFGNPSGQPDTLRQLDQLEHVTEVGPFVQSAVDVLPSTTVTGGLRYDWVNFSAKDRLIAGTNPDDSGGRLMAALSGSLGVTHTLADAATLYGNVGTSFETPTTTELTNRPDTAGGFNPTLQPQHAVNYELGVRGEVAGRLSYSVAAFRAEVKDELIAYQIPTSLGRVFYQNAARSRHQGIELGASAVLAPGLDLAVSWTYADYRYTEYVLQTQDLAGRPLSGVPQHWLHFLWQLRPGVARGGWAEVEQTHSSGMSAADALDIRTRPWWVTNLRLGWDGAVAGARFSPFVGFNNVFNRHYVSSVRINASFGRYYEPAPGRNMYVGFSLGAGR